MKTTRARRLRRAVLFAASAVSVAATVLAAGAGGIGHNLPQEAPLDFAHAIQEADSFA